MDAGQAIVALELELKAGLCPVDAQQVAGALDARWGTSPEAARLLARYFDTDDDRLSRAGMALRIRTEDGGLVQTLKSARQSLGGFHQLTEADAPVPDWAIDLAAIADQRLRQIVEDAQSGAGLQVRFETAITRRRWTVCRKHAAVEVAWDRGEIRAGQAAIPVCELEFELMEGQPEAVFALARDLLAGVPALLTLPSKAARGYRLANGQTWSQKLAGGKPAAVLADDTGEQSWGRAVDTLALAISGNLFRVFTQDGPEGPHQLRVALRRLRAALALHQPLIRKAVARDLAQKAKDLGRIVAPLRDCDVRVRALQNSAGLSPELDDALARHSGKIRAQVRENLRKAGATGFALFLLELAALGGWQRPPQRANHSLSDLSSRALDRLWRKTGQLGDRLSALDDEERHEFRKILKKLRYSLELTAKTPDIRLFLSKLKKLQDELGTLNDGHVFAAWHVPLDAVLQRQFANARAELEIGLSDREDLALGRACRHWRDLRKLPASIGLRAL